MIINSKSYPISRMWRFPIYSVILLNSLVLPVLIPLPKIIITNFVGAMYGFIPFSGIIFSYNKIVFTILRIPASGVKYKVISTSGSHLSVACLHCETEIGIFLASAVSHFPKTVEVASVMYTVVTPMLNPFIYRLRNRNMKSSLRRLHSRMV
ncbi:hypothetical protein H1C71_007415 [Ictidomys tridecemlineatus]|nr:hypothetical protein H1C71_007415 [Ictidomys tridecemlineatus]